MKTAYFDCFAGAAGDMIVGAMLHAGLDQQYLLEQLALLNIDKLQIDIAPTIRCGISALSFSPSAPDDQPHRNLADITALITASKLPRSIKARAITIFTTLAYAEAIVHATTIDKIHFHEVGAIDSIIDIVAACIGFEALKIDTVCCSPLSVGSGTVKCAHGNIPVPAPATLEIIKQAGAPITPGLAKTEMLTPTAAAILTTIATRFGPMPPMTIDSIGCGAGSRDPEEYSNTLRLVIGQSAASQDSNTDTICLLETNIDDITAETVSFVSDRLFDAGALDVFTTPIQMKDSRPAVKLSVIAPPNLTTDLEEIIFTEGITLGIRRQLLQRSKLPRQTLTVQTTYGPIDVKIALYKGKIVSTKPEHKQCALVAKQHGIPLCKVKNEAILLCKDKHDL